MIPTLMDQEEVANLFQDYNYSSLPVVDSENRLVGVITIDDIVDIIEGFDGKKKSIGHLGTGSIQLFILLLHIGMAISSDKKITLYIEEPEQNLHPALQSRLAEMFYEVWKKTEGRVEFVVETHSEYVIRKTQVFVAEKNYKDEKELKENNPFKVYYFPGDETLPYKMTYRKDGKFSNKFRPGFFDEAANLAFKIF